MKKLLLVGWDAADWKVIHPLLEEGMMPNVKGLIERGVMGNMATMYPMFSPMLWTSVATGKRPFNHGIHGFSEPDPSGMGVRPITNLSRTTRAIWNIATLMGMKSNVIGWWPSHPAEPIDGVMVSDHYHKSFRAKDEPWPMRPGSVHPERLIDNLAALRVHPQDLESGLVNLFVPQLFEMDQEKHNHRLLQLAKTIAECTSIANAGSAVMKMEPWTLSCVYFDSIDHFSHGFMNYHPPRMDWVDEEEYELWHEVVRSGYIYHDILLGRLLEQTDDETTIMLVSDHGFHSDHLRPRDLPDEPAGPAEQHRHYGVFLMAGPNVRQDELVFGSTLLDVCPTALTALGLPVGEDMEGKVLDVFIDPPEIDYVGSWDEVEGEDGAHPKDTVLNPVDAEASIRQLVELGYIDALPEDRQEAVDTTVRELKYNLARAYVDASLHVEAVPLLEELFVRWPHEFRFGVVLLNCYLALDRADDAAVLIEEVAAHKREDMVLAREELETFQKENAEKLEKLKEGDQDALTEEDRHKLRKLRARTGRNPIALNYLHGVVAAAQGKDEEALESLERAYKMAPKDVNVLIKLGTSCLNLKRFKQAREYFEATLEQDPENAEAWLGLARSKLNMPQAVPVEEAIEAARKAVGLIYYNPMGHFVLGRALARASMPQEAIDSLKKAIGQNPNFPEAHELLATLYRQSPGGMHLANASRSAAQEARKRVALLQAERMRPRTDDSAVDSPAMPENDGARFDYDPGDTVVVVSGLPRSGTSMMMQMLEAGGIEPVTDGVRTADEDNPRGYYEIEKTKSLHKDNEWVAEAQGKSVKVIAHLLPHLNPKCRYKILFMWRHMDEVIQSQGKMIEREGKAASASPEALAKTYALQLRRIAQWLTNNQRADVLYVDYAQAVQAPEEAAAHVSAFLGGCLDVNAMASAVQPKLHRQRAR